MKKILITIIATILVCACIVGGTMAWLMDKTDAVENTFTVGKVDIDLTETKNQEYVIVPGGTISKDPKVTVAANSEDCYVFVKIEKSTDWPASLEYIDDISDAWTELTGVDNVWYLTYTKADTAKDYQIFTGNTITVPGAVLAKEINEKTLTLTFTAYAVQKAAGTPAAAWELAKNDANY